MTVRSMTGFGRSSGEIDAWRWVWEVRSVNGRGLDTRIRLPSTFDNLDPEVRKALQARLKRGSVTVSLNATRQSGAMQVEVNSDVLKDVLAAADHVRQAAADATPPSVDGLLALKGVLDIVEPTESDAARRTLETAMLKDLTSAIDALIATRCAEGDRLAQTIAEKISEIETLTQKIETSPSRTPDAIQARLKDQVARLIGTNSGLDETRLHQEAVLIATRTDIEEEVKRLITHVAAAKQHLQSDGPIGRQLDFLAQEFNREANTICSKASADDISQSGLALKTAIDQLREQVQNIE